MLGPPLSRRGKAREDAGGLELQDERPVPVLLTGRDMQKIETW